MTWLRLRLSGFDCHLKILDDPSPSLLDKSFSPEFCSFIDDCLQKDPVARPTAEKVNLWLNILGRFQELLLVLSSPVLISFGTSAVTFTSVCHKIRGCWSQLGNVRPKYI